MGQDSEYYFTIDEFSPETLPMSRLAEYMADLARLAGDEGKVHFRRLDKGSAVVVHWVEPDVAPTVHDRITLAGRGLGPLVPLKAIQSINQRLEEDGKTARLFQGSAEIIYFPGRDLVTEFIVGPIVQSTSIEGTVIRIGGRKKIVPVQFEMEAAGVQSRCFASRDTAKKLAQHIFGSRLRVSGPGAWLRSVNGQWLLEKLTIESFEVLRQQSLSDELADFRSLSSGWDKAADPWAELHDLRHGGDET